MIHVSRDTHPEIYTDYEAALELLFRVPQQPASCLPPEKVLFHLYSEVKNEKELLAVKSFYATQDLDHCTLVLWSDCDVRDNQALAPFRSLIDFRVFDAHAEAKGTVLESRGDVVAATDTLHYMLSGLLRFLACHKYGGIWFDMDMVLLRDLNPILGQEFAYMWGSELDFAGFGPCAAFMGINRDSNHSRICMEELLTAPVRPNTVSRDHEMLAKVYRRRPFTVFPSAFFNTEWQINSKYPGRGTAIEKGWFSQTPDSGQLFPGAFSWHWHNSSYRNATVEPGSKFDLLSKATDSRLRALGMI